MSGCLEKFLFSVWFGKEVWGKKVWKKWKKKFLFLVRFGKEVWKNLFFIWFGKEVWGNKSLEKMEKIIFLVQFGNEVWKKGKNVKSPFYDKTLFILFKNNYFSVCREKFFVGSLSDPRFIGCRPLG